MPLPEPRGPALGARYWREAAPPKPDEPARDPPKPDPPKPDEPAPDPPKPDAPLAAPPKPREGAPYWFEGPEYA